MKYLGTLFMFLCLLACSKETIKPNITPYKKWAQLDFYIAYPFHIRAVLIIKENNDLILVREIDNHAGPMSSYYKDTCFIGTFDPITQNLKSNCHFINAGSKKITRYDYTIIGMNSELLVCRHNVLNDTTIFKVRL